MRKKTVNPLSMEPMVGFTTSSLDVSGTYYSQNVNPPVVSSEDDPIIVGSQLDCSTGTWIPLYEPINFTYQWYLNGSPIVGATSNSYTTLEGGIYKCVVTATNSLNNSSSVQSNTIILGLELTWDNIANVPVSDPSSVAQWNTYFNLPTNGNPFVGALVDGNLVYLYGGSNILLDSGTFSPPPTFLGDQHILKFVDRAQNVSSVVTDSESQFNGCKFFNQFTSNSINKFASAMFFENDLLSLLQEDSVEEMFDYVCYGCVSLPSIRFPNLKYITSPTGDAYTFYGCIIVNEIYLPSIITMGNSVTDATIFGGITGQTITLTVPSSLMTCNGGNPHASIQELQANNTVTIITV